jgi:hypothetical protein
MEVWKDVIGFDGKYSVSNLGNVRSNGFYVIPNSEVVKPFWKKPTILKPWILTTGYECVGLGRVYRKTVHRLVMEHFSINKDNYKDINHINGIKTDNRLENLEWCSRSQNNIHAYKIGLRRMGIDNKSALTCINIETGIFYDNAREAYKYSNIKFTETYFRRMLKGLNPNKTPFKLV